MSGMHINDEQLTDYLLGRLADAEQAAVEQHLDHCSECEQRAAAATPRDSLVGLLSSVIEHDTAPARFDGEASDTPPMTSRAQTSGDANSISPSSLYEPPRELLTHGRYRIIRPLGSGGMGTVWLAEHLVMQRQVALKVMRPEWIGKAGALERFRREVHAAAKLNHVNVADAYDAERIGDTLFLVAEYVDGETLSEVLIDGPLPVVDACRAVRDAACGLAHAHAAGLVHRDVKPGNLIRNREGVVKVLDFGLVTASRGDSSLTGSNMMVGTPDYVAPEQAEDPTCADARSDLYSLGCTLYHLLSGEPPFTAASTLKKLDAHRYAEPPRLRQLPAALQQVLTRMMAKSPKDRFQTAAEVSEALRPFCAGDVRSGLVAWKRSGGLSPRTAVLLAGCGLFVGLVLLFGYWARDRMRIPAAPQSSVDVRPTEQVREHAAAAEGLSPARTFPLLVPTAIGDGRREDFQVVNTLLTMNAMQDSPQVWLNFDYVRSRRISIFAKLRFVEAGDDANLKLVLLADQSGDYSLQIRPDERQIVIHHAKGSTVTLLDGYRLPSEFGSDWINVEFRLRDDRLTAVVDGREVLKARCEGTGPYYPCISALHCVAELNEPRAVVVE